MPRNSPSGQDLIQVLFQNNRNEEKKSWEDDFERFEFCRHEVRKKVQEGRPDFPVQEAITNCQNLTSSSRRLYVPKSLTNENWASLAGPWIKEPVKTSLGLSIHIGSP